MRGRVAAENTVRVDGRPDATRVVKEEGGAVVAVLMNEIHPTVLAELAASVVIYSMTRKKENPTLNSHSKQEPKWKQEREKYT
jgi:hypothetical protein